MNYSSRLFLYAPFALLLIIAAGMGVHWWFVAGALEKRLDAMQTHEAMPGVTIRYASRSIGGFPFRIDAVFDDFRVEVATGRGAVRWRAEHFALHGLTYGRDELIFEAAGRQSLGWGRVHGLDFQTGSLHASAIRDEGGLARFDLDLIAFGSSAFTAARIQFHVRRAQDALDVAASGDDIHLSPRLRGAFGGRIRLVALQGEVSAAHALDGLRDGRADWQGGVESWRKASGMLRAEPFEIDWGTLDMLAHGELGLDGSKRPALLLDFKIAGMPDWLALGVPSRPGGFASALGDRAVKAGASESGKMGVIFGIRDGVAYLGDEPVGMVGPLY